MTKTSTPLCAVFLSPYVAIAGEGLFPKTSTHTHDQFVFNIVVTVPQKSKEVPVTVLDFEAVEHMLDVGHESDGLLSKAKQDAKETAG